MTCIICGCSSSSWRWLRGRLNAEGAEEKRRVRGEGFAGKKQIPFGDDNKNGNSNGNSNSKGKGTGNGDEASACSALLLCALCVRVFAR